jgi:hypothetical protein
MRTINLIVLFVLPGLIGGCGFHAPDLSTPSMDVQRSGVDQEIWIYVSPEDVQELAPFDPMSLMMALQAEWTEMSFDWWIETRLADGGFLFQFGGEGAWIQVFYSVVADKHGRKSWQYHAFHLDLSAAASREMGLTWGRGSTRAHMYVTPKKPGAQEPADGSQ